MSLPSLCRIVVLVLACVPAALVGSQAIPSSANVAPHPLDPLSAEEIALAAKLISAAPQFPAGAKFAMLVLKEPPKTAVVAATPGALIPRHAFAVILDRQRNRTFEAVADLTDSRVASWIEVKGVQPAVLESEYDTFVDIVKGDTRFQDAIRKRGINQLDDVQVDFWAVGQVAPQYQTRRLLRAVAYLKGSGNNFYSRPIEGIGALVDMSAERVIEFFDTGVVPLPAGSELDETSTGTRPAPKPLHISQPEGASFTIAGQEIRWQKWRFRYTMHPREGLVLHMVSYEDEGRTRPILYRASLSEMAVPYGDTDRNWRWRSAFDVGEYGMGRLAAPIEPGTDAPSNAHLVDVTFANDDGEAYVLKNGVGVYERDGGMLWKHFESFGRTNESRRARQLVLFFITTIGNYDYAINWIFHQDGVLELDAALTGIMLAKGVREAKATHSKPGAYPSGHLVAANVVAPHHQHFFNFRLDFDVDGPVNEVREMNTRAMAPAPGNPNLNGMIMEETRLATEVLAQRRVNVTAARTWSVVNPSVQNALGHHTSYILVPGVNSIPYVAPASQVRRRAGFVNQHFWATRYHDDEMYAAGAYPNQSLGGAGLPRWVANNETLSNHDVVVWYTMGVTHIPRPEEWPVMPVTHVGFRMIPGGFFSRNPALDVPK